MKKYLFFGIIASLFAIMMTACGESDIESSGISIKSIEILDVPSEGLTMLSGDTKKLEIRINPESARDAKIIWASSAPTVVSVTQDGSIRAYEEGTATISVSDNEKKVSASVAINVKSHDDSYDFTASGSVDGHEYVDLGLSVKWATCNLGANNKEDIGEYYAWQETKPWTEYTFINYFWDIDPCDKNHILSSIYDAVSANWSKNWRMPTCDEMEELVKPENCDWYWHENFNNSGNDGYVVRSKKTNKCIFLAAGKYKPHEDYLNVTKVEGHYWTSFSSGMLGSLTTKSAESLFFNYGIKKTSIDARADGLTIRGVVGKANEYIPETTLPIDAAETAKQGFSVCGSKDGYTYVDLGLPSRTMWATYNVGATSPGEYGNFYAWGETEPKTTYNTSTYKFFTGEFGGDFGATNNAQYNKYIIFEPHGTPDYKTHLDPEDDAATVNWSKAWCMPTVEQVDELAYYCVFRRKDITVNGKKVMGCVGTSKINGNNIYIPYAGWEYDNRENDHFSVWYWTSDLGMDRNDVDGSDYRAYYMDFKEQDHLLTVYTTSRMQGLSVRAVLK